MKFKVAIETHLKLHDKIFELIWPDFYEIMQTVQIRPLLDSEMSLLRSKLSAYDDTDFFKQKIIDMDKRRRNREWIEIVAKSVMKSEYISASNDALIREWPEFNGYEEEIQSRKQLKSISKALTIYNNCKYPRRNSKMLNLDDDVSDDYVLKTTAVNILNLERKISDDEVYLSGLLIEAKRVIKLKILYYDLMNEYSITIRNNRYLGILTRFSFCRYYIYHA